MKPSNTEFRDIFNVAAASYDEGISPYALMRRTEFVLAHAKGECLEVGAGTGEITRALVAHGHNATATDIAPRMVEEMHKKGLRAEVCDAEHLPFGDTSFDTVICGEAIYYLDHPELFIEEARRVLRPGGVLLLTFATTMSTFYDRLRSFLRFVGIGSMYFDDKMHRFPRVAPLRVLLHNKGFDVVKENRLMVIPSGGLDVLNRFLEKTPLKYVAACAALKATKRHN